MGQGIDHSLFWTHSLALSVFCSLPTLKFFSSLVVARDGARSTPTARVHHFDHTDQTFFVGEPDHGQKKGDNEKEEEERGKKCWLIYKGFTWTIIGFNGLKDNK